MIIEKGIFLICKIGEEKIALSIYGIREILWDIKVYPLPQVSEYIIGILAEEKKLAVVVDLAKFFNIKETAGNVFLKIKINEKLAFLALKEVEEILEVREEEIYPCPPLFSSTIPNYYISGLIKKEDTFIPIIDLTKILDHEEIKPFTFLSK
ncbi:MAG: chemotaxis protein CheW [candidate division WOR-3 bacterium]|nr:chemotaxis protein CheW [candidate division WOR-3 bacterium]MDW8114552.1 chemotaxis protein CheW [candidate division WOR-3 bacterium]